MFPFSFSLVRVLTLTLLGLMLCLPVPLHAEPEQVSPVAAPAPSVVVPEPVAIRADPQPLTPPPAQKPSSSFRVGVRSALSVLLDEEGGLDLPAVTGRLGAFRPYDIAPLSTRPGTLWMHLDLADVKDSAPHTLWLDLGTQLPSGVQVWISADGLNWQAAQAQSRGVYGLLSAGRQGEVLIRMDGLPGLWFNPALSSPRAVLSSPDRLAYLLSLSALGLLGVLCLLLSVTERGEGRFWTGVLAFSAMAQMLWGVPSTPAGSMGTGSFPGMFAAGVALFMLPHVGRVLMRTRLSSPPVDVLFLLFALPGACAAIVPLLPGMAWTARLLSLWPLAALLCLVPALVLAMRGVQGAVSFTMACLAMGGGAVISLWGMTHGLESPWWGLAVQAGSAVGLLFLSSAAPHRETAPQVQELPAPRQAETRANTYKDNSLAALRRAFRGTVEELFDEACRLDQALTRAGVDKDKVEIMTHADGMVAAARRLSESALDLPASATLPEASLQVFELRQVIRQAFASVFDEAEKKGLGLAWYVAPQLGSMFRGDASRLTALLSLLLADSIRASSHGAVSLHVRRSTSSTHPGHLQFTVSDNGEGLPPRGRQSMLPARAWELAAAHGGVLFIDSTPQGMELTFSMECTAMEADGVTEKSVPSDEGTEASSVAPLILLASPDGLSRQMYVHYFEDMGCRVWEARDAEEAAALYAVSPAALVIFEGTLGEDDMVQGLAAIRMFEGEQALPAVPFLLLARDDTQAERMAKAGCDEALLLPVVRKDLRAMAKWLLSPTSERPVLSAQRVTLAAVLAGAHSGNARMQRKTVRRSMTQGPDASVAPEREERTVESAPEEPHVLSESTPLSLEGAASTERKDGWIASLFRQSGRQVETPVERTARKVADETSVSSSETSEASSEGEVVELLSEHVLVEESGVQELTPADMVTSEKEPAEDGELIELEEALIREQIPAADAEEPLPQSVQEEETAAEVSVGEDGSEEMETPSERIVEGLNRISQALIQGDVQAIRGGARELSFIADRYGMHTLADMARCFRAAWEEGDVEAAAQIVEEMRTEASRL